MIKDVKKIFLLLAAFLYATSITPAFATDAESLGAPEKEAKENKKKEKNNSKPKKEEEGSDKNSDKRKKEDKSQKQEKDNDPLEEENLEATIEELNNIIALKDQEIASLKKDLDELLPFRVELLENLCSSIGDFESLPFSAISQEKVDSIRKRIHPFLSHSQELTENDQRLQKLTERKGIYDSFRQSLSTLPYGEELKKRFADFQNALSSDSIPAQQMEIAELSQMMAAYPALIPEFGKVIDEFQIQLEYARNNKDLSEALDMAKVTFNMNDNFDSSKKEMAKVDYMDSLLAEYLKLLSSKNPLDERIIKIEETVASMAEALPKTNKNK